MKSSDNSDNRFTSTLRDLKVFFASCLSMHMLPVVFALVLIVVAERKGSSRLADTQIKQMPVAKAATLPALNTTVPALSNYVFLNPTNLTQVVTMYKISRLVMNVVN